MTFFHTLWGDEILELRASSFSNCVILCSAGVNRVAYINTVIIIFMFYSTKVSILQGRRERLV